MHFIGSSRQAIIGPGLLRETELDDALPDKCPAFTSDENMP